MLIDPRPYTYEYRKPRYSNPTLYSSKQLANPATSTKAYTIDTPTSPMITSPLKKERCIPPLKNFKK